MSKDNREEVKKQAEAISKITATSLVTGILRKHGVDKNSLDKVSSEDRTKLKNLINELKEQSDSLFKKPIKER